MIAIVHFQFLLGRRGGWRDDQTRADQWRQERDDVTIVMRRVSTLRDAAPIDRVPPKVLQALGAYFGTPTSFPIEYMITHVEIVGTLGQGDATYNIEMRGIAPSVFNRNDPNVRVPGAFQIAARYGVPEEIGDWLATARKEIQG